MELEADFTSRVAGVVVVLVLEGMRERLMEMLPEVVWMERESLRRKSPWIEPEVAVRVVERAWMINGGRGVGEWNLREVEGAEMWMGV